MFEVKNSVSIQQLVQPDIAIGTLCAFALRAAQSVPMYAMQVN